MSLLRLLPCKRDVAWNRDGVRCLIQAIARITNPGEVMLYLQRYLQNRRK